MAMHPRDVRDSTRGLEEVENEHVHTVLDSLRLDSSVGSDHGDHLVTTTRNVPSRRPTGAIVTGSPQHATNPFLLQNLPFQEVQNRVRYARDCMERGRPTAAFNALKGAVKSMDNSTSLDTVKTARGVLLDLCTCRQEPRLALFLFDKAPFRDHNGEIWPLHLFLGALYLSWESSNDARSHCRRAVQLVEKEYGPASSQMYDALQFQAVITFTCGHNPQTQALLSRLPLDRHAETYKDMRRTERHSLLSEAQWDELINQSKQKPSRELIGKESSADWECWPLLSLFRSSHKTNSGTEKPHEHSEDEPALLTSANDAAMKKKYPNSPLPSNTYNSGSEGERSFIAGSTNQTRNAVRKNPFDASTWRFINTFAKYLVDRCTSIAGRGEPTSSAPSRVESSSFGLQVNTEATEHASRSSPLKRNRRRRDRSSGKDEEGDDGPRKSKDAQQGSAEKITKIFACPYAKFDRQRYSEQNPEEKCYRGCASNYLRDISRVKQHLCRTHKRPDWYCPVCYDSFKNRETMNTHLQGRSCEAKAERYQEMMTDEQYNAVKRRAAGTNSQESWYQIFVTLFPDAPLPLSPYVSSCNEEAVKYFVELFHSHGAEEFYNFLRDRREQSETFVPLGPSTQAIVDEAFEIALPDYLGRVSSNQSSSDQEVKTSRSRKRLKTDKSVSAMAPPSNSDPMVAPESATVLHERDDFAEFLDPSLLIAGDGNDDEWPVQANQQDTIFDLAQIDPAFDAYAGLLAPGPDPGLDPKRIPWSEDAGGIVSDGRYARAEGVI